MRSKFRLGDLCEFHRGASVPRARMSADGDLIYIHYGDLYKGFSIKIDVENPQKSLPFISKQEPIKQHQWLEDQDIVYVLTSETVEDLGHSFLFNNPEQRPAVAGTETTIVRVVRRDLLLPAYLNYVMHSPRFCALLRQYVKGMKVFRVHPDDVARIEIEAPSLMDQQAVVDTLDALYEKEMLNNRLNDYLSELIEAIFVEWFVGVNSRYPTKKVLMDEIAFVNAGGDKPDVWQKCQTEEFPIPIFSNGIDNEGLYGYTTTAKITKPSITVSARGTIGFTCLRHEPYYPIVRLVSATPRDYVTAEYLYLWVKRATVIGVGTTQQQLTVPMFKNYEVDVPDATSMEEFTRVTTPLFKMVDANKAENRKLSELRNALLPKLISGEVDISKVVI